MLISPRLRAALTASLIVGAACSEPNKPRIPASIQFAGGNSQVFEVNSVLPVNPTVKVLDAEGLPVSGVMINWNVSTGGTVGSPSSSTNEEGIATPGQWKLSTVAGANNLLATAPVIEKSVTFTATGSAGVAASITPLTGMNQNGAAGDLLPVAPTVRVLDAFGNPCPNRTVMFTVTAGSGTLTGATATTNPFGVAALGSWTLGTAGTNSVTATVTQAAPVAVSINATASAAASQVVINTQPAGAITGEAFDTQPIVSIRDAGGNVVFSSTASVTASIASGTGTLSGTTTAIAANGVATFTNLAVTGTSAVTLRFTSGSLTQATSSSFTPTPPPPFNMTIDRVHFTQGTQTYVGAVPLVAGRAAMARVFVKANVTNNTAQPQVRLRTYTGAGTLINTYTASPTTASVPKLIDETVLSLSWNIPIPPNEMILGMTAVADVDPTNTVVESSDADNSFPASGTPFTLDMRQVSTMKVTFVPVTQPGVVQGNVTEANKELIVDFARRVYPIDTMEIVVHAPFAYTQVLNGSSYDNTWTGLLTAISNLRNAEGAADRFYYGVVHPNYSSGGTGFGQIGNGSAIGMDFTGTVNPSTNYFNMTIAHEWGHNFGRFHVGCGGPANPDLGYPHDTQTIGTPGFDLQYNVLRVSSQFKDLMSYCQPVWISDYSYKAVMDYRATHYGPPVAAAQRVLLVSGWMGPNGMVLEPAYEVEAPPVLPDRSGPYSVQALDQAGNQIFSVGFEGTEVDHAPGVRMFTFAVPLAQSGELATLRLMNGTQELTRRSRLAPLTLGGATTNAGPAGRLVRTTTGRSRLEWDARAYAGAMVRDPATGQVLAILTGGVGEIAVARDVDVLFSNGVTSVKQRVQIPPR